MTLDSDEFLHLATAQGFLQLGLPLDAEREILQIRRDARRSPEALAVGLSIYGAMRRWEPMRHVAGLLAASEPDEPMWTLSLAFATRHAQSLQAARRILTSAVHRNPGVAMFHFNLACYDCQLGDLRSASVWLQAALTINPKLGQAAIMDPDLAPLRRPLG